MNCTPFLYYNLNENANHCSVNHLRGSVLIVDISVRNTFKNNCLHTSHFLLLTWKREELSGFDAEHVFLLVVCCPLNTDIDAFYK